MSDSFFLKPVEDIKTVDITPLPYLVVKSKLVSHGSAVEPTKIFINIVHDKTYPDAPDVAFSPSIVYPLIMNNEWEIPIITTSHITDTDKQGSVCFVWDCCVNSVCIDWCNEHEELKDILVEWCLESCELRSEMEIDRNALKFPKMKYKGKEMRKIEVLENDLNSSLAEIETPKASSSASEFLEIRRNFDEEDDSDQLMQLRLPGSSSSSTINNKPLIQEIDPISVPTKKSDNQIIEVQELKNFNYEVTMGKPTGGKDTYKLKVEIKTNMTNCNSLDFQVQYNIEDDMLIVKNLNTHIYKEKSLELPLPKIQSQGPPNLKSFFIKSENKLYIII